MSKNNKSQQMYLTVYFWIFFLGLVLHSISQCFAFDLTGKAVSHRLFTLQSSGFLPFVRFYFDFFCRFKCFLCSVCVCVFLCLMFILTLSVVFWNGSGAVAESSVCEADVSSSCSP